MIAIVDYGLGNIRAFANIYKNCGLPFRICTTADELSGATKILLPGVGAFDHAMARLGGSGMQGRLSEMVLNDKVPVLGICVGMQILAASSEEGSRAGLGWIDGAVRKMRPPAGAADVMLPHMGWNDVLPRSGDGILGGLGADSAFYFLHSYCFHCNDPQDVLAETEYGSRFTSAVKHGHIHGVQFHPEKSHHNGIRLLRNFGAL